MAELTPARKAMLQFMTAVAALHVSAIAAYYLLHIGQSPTMRQRVFGWTWIILTAAVVFGGLQRIRRVRRSGGAR